MCFEKATTKSICYSKKAREGVLEQLEIMGKYFPDSQSVYSGVLKRYLSRDVRRDDIVDAMVLAVTARESRGRLRSLPPELEMDEKGLPMAIWYHEFKREL